MKDLLDTLQILRQAVDDAISEVEDCDDFTDKSAILKLLDSAFYDINDSVSLLANAIAA